MSERIQSDPIPIGRCIYCGASDVPLSDEHAIPYGLNGGLVLKRASCERHAAITSRIELRTLRGVLGRARARLRLKSRRKQRNVCTTVRFDHGFGWCDAQFDAAEFAGINSLPVFAPPSFFENRTSHAMQVIGLDHLRLGSPVPPIRGLVTSTTLRYQYEVDIDVWSFARMVAKIGYCCAVATFGYDRFVERFVLPSILTDSDEVNTWVGSDAPRPWQSQRLHEVSVAERDDGLVLASVWLLAPFMGQPYSVVVGRVRK